LFSSFTAPFDARRKCPNIIVLVIFFIAPENSLFKLFYMKGYQKLK
ncbi:unnamed protein product, partial [marine sediment metagenome]